MDHDKNALSRPAFRRIGGDLQLKIERFADLSNVLALDDAFWALNSIDSDTLRFERAFLDFVDSDRNGKIRTDEIRNAVRFVLAHLRDGSGLEAGSGLLKLDAVIPDSPDGAKILDAAHAVLENIGRTEAAELSLTDLQSEKEIKSCAFRNGDGVIVADPERSEAFNRRLNMIVDTVGGVTDLSGNKGIGIKEIDLFCVSGQAWLDWVEAPAADEKLRPFAGDGEAVYSVFKPLRDAIDAYFLNSAALDFFGDDPERMAKKALIADVRAPGEVRAVLEGVTLAEPRRDRTLDLTGALNPLFAEPLRKLFSFDGTCSFLTGGKLERDGWERFKSELAAFDAWRTARPSCGDSFAAIDAAELRVMLGDPVLEELRTACMEDLSAGEALSGLASLHKLLLYQKNLLELLNNFVSLSSLFSYSGPAPIQAGKLVMDGRHYTLAVPVRDVAEHKRIVELSDICVVYVELSSSIAAVVPPFKTLAVAITAGSMRNLFVGKRGIFFCAGGDLFDAKVTAFIEQPVSVSEALKEPFRKFGSFFGGQLNKFFVGRSSGLQKSVGDQISTGKFVETPPAAAAPNGSMLLMGGSIGVAALGSSIAFIAKSLQNVSFVNVLSVIGAILLIFGGPMIAVSLTKLHRRNLSRFFEACGCAVNRRMRLSHRMGLVFSFTPRMPEAELLREDLVKLWNYKAPRSGRFLKFLLLLLLLIGLAGAAVRYYHSYCSGRVADSEGKAGVRDSGRVPEPNRPIPLSQNNLQEKKP